MSLTPSHPRTMNPAWGGAALKLTPANSPALKNARSPMKTARADASLNLKQVIGTTSSSANAFDSPSCIPNISGSTQTRGSDAVGRTFGFTAGAAAVIATVEDGKVVSQRFYRARPSAHPINSSGSVYGGPPTPSQNESRSRTGASLREAGIGASPLASPAADWSDSPQSKTWSRERIKAATCISFSPDGKYLAVGETGYKPRVLIFSTASDAPSDTPLSSLSEHTFGVRCVAFSPDSQYLASLGSANDGFLYIWSINPRNGAATLHSSNKCTSVINRIAWMGNNLITVGTRHVKVWRVEEQSSSSRTKPRQSEGAFLSSSIHKTLCGRNCLLETMLDANFTSVVAVAQSKAIVASDRGDICLIDDIDSNQRFVKVAEAGFPVSSMAVDDKGRLHLAGGQGGVKTLNVKETIETSALTPPPSPSPRVETPTITLTTGSHQVQAIVALDDFLVTVDSQHSIRVSHLSAPDDDSVVGDVIQKLSAHGNAVLGVAPLKKPNIPDASFYTWSAEGSVLFWGQDGICRDSFDVELEQLEGFDLEPNGLKTVRVSTDASYLVTGDRYGVLRIINLTQRSHCLDFKAHASEITGIAIHEGAQQTYIASCARDRMVQILTNRNDKWDVMQTLDEHVGAVTGIIFSRNGTRLVSSSSDRTLVVRDLVSREEDGVTMTAFLILRTVILKSTPVSMAWDADHDHVLLVSTIDRQVHRYDLRDGQSLSSFRAADGDGGDAVVLSSLVHIPRPHGAPLIAGVSSTDKSIRLYDETGTLITRDWGHTEGVTDIALVSAAEDNDCGQRSLVTVAVDGTIFVWNLELRTSHRLEISKSLDDGTPTTPTNQDLLASKAPLRRVLSQSELARFQRSPDDDRSTPINRSPKLRKKTSKFTLTNAPKLEPSPSMARDTRSTVSAQGQSTARRFHRNRSPSPPSPRVPQASARRSSVDVRVRPKPSTNEFGSLGASTESLCRTLRAYRKRLATSPDSLSSELARDVERELAHTARAVGEKAKSGIDESVMVKLLDQYSERLVNLLDEKIAASVALRVRENSEGLLSAGRASPALTVERHEQRGCENHQTRSRKSSLDTNTDTAPLSLSRTSSVDATIHLPIRILSADTSSAEEDPADEHITKTRGVGPPEASRAEEK